ncbi:cardiolipin synthase [Corynebacterium uberis]|uniref:cardiolipin synthase n=1 Tax=Corynebacterium TaxID=1716 RepID=UPI001D0B8E25|nr:cardiolipin synthase [Corynebacterium uberis]MCZ9309715.1 cardiolipin synthase [Corynebacterium sp. c6VSa_13]UDL73519.1 cardiolipin synthase [Corynebacterium uberis]UDL75601.1 cardiolipin synthase [Corynebacterium uberis]UDL77814.1 cardiolipin synthase [Corynebacterium uberis]UDL80097.1 cardiolipin synthase [Corynebacterium uberis]
MFPFPTFNFATLDTWQALGLVLDYSIKAVAIGYVPEGRRPSSSTAWLLAILLLPVVGLPLFLLMGSPYINRRRHRIQQEANVMIEDVQADTPDYPDDAHLSPEITSMVALNRRLTNLPAVAATNRGLLADYDNTIARMAAAIDTARETVHVQIYIMAWDDTTDVFFRSLERAVARGVTVRLMFDHIGSLKYPKYRTLGRRLTSIGVDWHLMLPLQPWRGRFRRPDLRNHRKLLIIDGKVGFVGSQNMIDRSYLMRANKKAGRQWIDIMVELEGPIVDSLETIFAVDWYTESGEPLALGNAAPPGEAVSDESGATNVVQVVPSGPGYTTEPNLRMFTSIVHHAKHRLILCSPYFIPDESLLEAVTTACYRGVQVDLLVSEKADQFTVHHAQSSYYQTLLEAGMRIYQFPEPYVLHTKFLLADPDGDPVAVLGSSNMDMRSFGLNYEVSLMITRGNLITQLADLTEAYTAVAKELTLAQWKRRGIGRRYVDNVMRLTSALQ